MSGGEFINRGFFSPRPNKRRRSSIIPDTPDSYSGLFQEIQGLATPLPTSPSLNRTFQSENNRPFRRLQLDGNPWARSRPSKRAKRTLATLSEDKVLEDMDSLQNVGASLEGRPSCDADNTTQKLNSSDADDIFMIVTDNGVDSGEEARTAGQQLKKSGFSNNCEKELNFLQGTSDSQKENQDIFGQDAPDDEEKESRQQADAQNKNQHNDDSDSGPEVSEEDIEDNSVVKRSSRGRTPSRGRGRGRSTTARRTGKRQNYVSVSARGKKKTFGERRQPGRGGNRSRKTKYLQQAGQGGGLFGEYTSDQKGVCFRCGNPGHWVNECPENLDNIASTSTSLRNVKILDDAEEPVDLKPLTKDFTPEGINALFKDTFCMENLWDHQLETLSYIISDKENLNPSTVLMSMGRGKGKRTTVLLAALLLDGITVCVSNAVWETEGLPKQFKVARLFEGQDVQQVRNELVRIQQNRVNLIMIQPSKLLSYNIAEILKNISTQVFLCVEDAHLLYTNCCPASVTLKRAFSAAHDLLKPSTIVFSSSYTNNEVIDCFQSNYQYIKVVSNLDDIVIQASVKVQQLTSISGSSSTDRKNQSSDQAQVLDVKRMQDLAKQLHYLIKKGSFKSCKSIVVYCSSMKLTEQVSTILQSGNIHCLAVHKLCQKALAYNAISQFGKKELGVLCVQSLMNHLLAKHTNVDGVIHVGLPTNTQEYYNAVKVLPSGAPTCVFYCEEWYLDQRCNLYKNICQESCLEKLLGYIFTENPNSSRFRVIDIQDVQQSTGIDRDQLELILAILMDHQKDGLDIKWLRQTQSHVEILFYNTPAKELAESNIAIESMMNVCKKPKQGKYTASLQSICDDSNESPDDIFENLRVLAALKEISFSFTKNWSHVVEIVDVQLQLRQIVNIVGVELKKISKLQAKQLDQVFRIFSNVENKKTQKQQRDCLVSLLNTQINVQSGLDGDSIGDENRNFIQVEVSRRDKMDIKTLIAGAKSRNIEINDINVAKILYGIGTEDWKDSSYWGSHRNWDFEKVVDIAAEIIQQMEKK